MKELYTAILVPTKRDSPLTGLLSLQEIYLKTQSMTAIYNSFSEIFNAADHVYLRTDPICDRKELLQLWLFIEAIYDMFIVL